MKSALLVATDKGVAVANLEAGGEGLEEGGFRRHAIVLGEYFATIYISAKQPPDVVPAILVRYSWRRIGARGKRAKRRICSPLEQKL